MAKKYARKRNIVEAIQFKPGECGQEISDIQNLVGTKTMEYDPDKNQHYLKLYNEDAYISEGDFVVKLNEMAFMVMSSEEFYDTYEVVSEVSTC